MTAILTATNLHKAFGDKTAVDGISLSLKKGEVLGFLGPNGAGKSTTMKMLAGYLRPDIGQVEVQGFDMWREPQIAKHLIGYLPEGAPLYPDMLVYDFLQFMARVRGFLPEQIKEKLPQAIRKARIGDVLGEPIETLSKGYKRRVGLAQAILHDPDILILDEPTDGLDPNQKFHVRALIREMAQEKAIIISTHILEEVDAVCTRAMIISNGTIKLDTTPALMRRESAFGAHVSLQIERKFRDRFVAGLAQMPQVAKVEDAETGTQDSLAILKVYPANNAIILEDIHSLLAEKRIRAVQIHEQQPSLDSIFREMTAV